MIKITMKDGRPRWIAAAHVVDIGDGEPGMRSISMSNGARYTVRDDMDALAERVNDMLVVPE